MDKDHNGKKVLTFAPSMGVLQLLCCSWVAIPGFLMQGQVSWWCLDILNVGILIPTATLLTFMFVMFAIGPFSYCKAMLPVTESEVSVNRVT